MGSDGLNDVQGWGLGGGADVGAGVGMWDQFLSTALHTISASLQNCFCETHIWRLLSSKAL